MTWQHEATHVSTNGIACPAADTCFAVGAMTILSTHPAGGAAVATLP